MCSSLQCWEFCGQGELLQVLTCVSSLCSVLCCSFPAHQLSREWLFSEERDSSFNHLSHTLLTTESAHIRNEKRGEKPGKTLTVFLLQQFSLTVLFSRMWRAPSGLPEQTEAVTCGFFLFTADRRHLLYRPLHPLSRDEPGLTWVPVPAPDLPPHGAGVRQTAPQQLAAARHSNPREEEIPFSWQ